MGAKRRSNGTSKSEHTHTNKHIWTFRFIESIGPDKTLLPLLLSPFSLGSSVLLRLLPLSPKAVLQVLVPCIPEFEAVELLLKPTDTILIYKKNTNKNHSQIGRGGHCQENC